MNIKVKSRFQKGSARKLRPILHLIKGKSAKDAVIILTQIPKRKGSLVNKLVKSGIDIAEKNNLESDKIFVKSIMVDQAKGLKRHRFESKGRVTRITKHQSHISLIISDDARNESKKVNSSKNNLVKKGQE